MTFPGKREWLEVAEPLALWAVRLGLISGAAVSALVGQWLLAGVLALVAVGVGLRLWRLRRRRRP